MDYHCRVVIITDAVANFNDNISIQTLEIANEDRNTGSIDSIDRVSVAFSSPGNQRKGSEIIWLGAIVLNAT